jgi:glycosyltransferase involved in cell wall biosynthesis
MLTGHKICHFSTVHESWDVRIRDRECVSLANAGAEIHLFATNHNDYVYKGVTIHALTEHTNRFKRILYAKAALKKVLAARPHVIHFHDPELVSLMLKTKKRKNVTIKIFFDCHEDTISHVILKTYIPKIIKNMVQKIVTGYLKKAAVEFDAIITADEGVNNQFKQWGADPVLLYNFPPANIYRKSPDWNFSTRPYDIIYPGSTPIYHLSTMFQIADELKKKGRKTKWLILTQFPFNNNSWIKNQLAEFGLEDSFHFKPLAELAELPDYLYKAKIGIIPLPDTPKFHNNIPGKLFDYFLAGLPVIMSDLPPTKIFTDEHNIAVRVKAGDIPGYALAIHDLLNDSNRMIQMGQTAREIALKNYTWETQSPKLMKLYENLLLA